MKNFDEWNKDKKKLETKKIENIFNHKDVWWVKFGINIGSEQDGIGDNFERPVVIIKKLSSTTFLCAPLTTKYKDIKFRVYLSANKKDSYAILDQIRVLDSKRLLRKIGEASSLDFKKLKDTFSDIYK